MSYLLVAPCGDDVTYCVGAQVGRGQGAEQQPPLDEVVFAAAHLEACNQRSWDDTVVQAEALDKANDEASDWTLW